MAPLLLLSLLVAGLAGAAAGVAAARRRLAGPLAGVAWILYAIGIFAVLRLPGLRLLIPIVVLAFIAPFVAGPERVSRVLAGRRTTPGVVIDVTPRAAAGPPEATRRVEGEVIDDDPERPS